MCLSHALLMSNATVTWMCGMLSLITVESVLSSVLTSVNIREIGMY